MPLYRFETTLGDATESTEVECKDSQAMRDRALELAQRSIGDLQASFWEHPRWALRVTDDSNMTILSLTLTAD